MTGWIFILLSAFSSLLIAHFLKISENRGLDTVRVLTVNYFTASFSALLFADKSGFSDAGTGVFPAFLLAILVGIIFILNFFIYSKSVFLNGIGISVAMMRISLIVPVLVSILFFGEFLSYPQFAGVLLVFIILYLLIPGKKGLQNEPLKAGGYLLLLFVGTGIGDTSLKVFEIHFIHLVSKELFMGLVFLTAFCCGLTTLIWKRKLKFRKTELIIGVMIGIPNLLTSLFLISALEMMNGAVVFSAVNLITVAGGTVLGVLYWRDRFLSSQWLGIFLAMIAILLLL